MYSTSRSIHMSYDRIEQEASTVQAPLSYASWMAFAVPLMVINTFFAWVWLCILQVGQIQCLYINSRRCDGFYIFNDVLWLLQDSKRDVEAYITV